MMMTSSKCRPRKGAGRVWLTVSRYQKPPEPFATDPLLGDLANKFVDQFFWIARADALLLR